MDTSTLFVAIAALILLAVTSMRYGVDSREGFPTQEPNWPRREPSRADV